MKFDDLKKQILDYEPNLLPFVADQLARAWINNPELLKEAMKEDIKKDRKGKKKEPEPVPTIYDCITVNEM